MNFTIVLCFACLALCLGGAVVCVSCHLLARAFHRHCLGSRLTLFYFFLSGAVAFVAVLFLFTPDPLHVFPLRLEDLLFLICLFVMGGCCAFFWKTVFPAALLCYLVLSFFTGIKLYRLFGTTLDEHAVTVTADSVYIDGSRFFISRNNQECIVLDVFVLPDRLLLPLPRVWFSVSGVVENEKVIGDSHVSEQFYERVVRVDDRNAVTRLISKYVQWIVRDHSHQYVRLPDLSCVPAVYTLSCRVRNKTVYCSFSKTL